MLSASSSGANQEIGPSMGSNIWVVWEVWLHDGRKMLRLRSLFAVRYVFCSNFAVFLVVLFQ